MNRFVYLAALPVVLGSIALADPTTKPADAASTASTKNDAADLKTGINFDEVALTDCIDYVRDTTQANIFVDWKTLEEAGIAKDTPVTLHLRRVNGRTVLKLILESAAPGKLISYPKDRVLNITTREKADTIMVTQTYPVDDLLMEVPDFTGAPTMDLNNTSSNGSRNGGNGAGGSGNSGGSSQGLFGSGGQSNQNNQTDKGSTKQERADQLIKMIQTTIRPDIWDVNGGKATIKYFNGHLIVTAPITVQDEL